MRKIAYIRVSSEGQNTARQKKALKAAGCKEADFYEEKISGKNTDRPQLQQMLDDLQEGDVIYITDLTRITRSTEDLFKLINIVRTKKANIKSLKDTWLDLSEENPYSQFLITVMGGVNQLERDLIQMRQREGIEIAKKEGKFKGRKVEVSIDGKKAEKATQAIQWYKEGKSVRYICKTLSIGTGTLYRLLEREGLKQ